MKTLNSLHCGAQSKLYLEPHLDVTVSRKPSWTPNSGLVRDYELPQQPVLSLRRLYHDCSFHLHCLTWGGRAPGLVYIFALYHYNTTYRMMRVGTQTQKTTQVAPRRAVHIKKKKNHTAFTMGQIALRMFTDWWYHEICIDEGFSFLKLYFLHLKFIELYSHSVSLQHLACLWWKSVMLGLFEHEIH